MNNIPNKYNPAIVQRSIFYNIVTSTLKNVPRFLSAGEKWKLDWIIKTHD